jgi:DNA-binding transcriptional ArsR family regulator
MQAHDIFSALSDPTRLEVLGRLVESGPATATELSASMPITRQAVAKHLAALDAAGLVDRARSGREVIYTFDPAPFEGVLAWMESIGTSWDDRLDRLRNAVE